MKLFRKKQPTFNTDRISLVKTILSSLEKKAEPSRLKLHFNCKCIGLDFERQTILFESLSPASKELKPFLISYDRLIGADGARSTVRSQFLKTQSFDFQQTTVSSCYKTIFLPHKPDQIEVNLKPIGIHVFRPEEGINVGAVPEKNGGYICLIFVTQNKKNLLNFQSVAQVKEFFQRYCPKINLLLSESEAEAFIKRPIAN